jgi:hypothetical protein
MKIEFFAIVGRAGVGASVVDRVYGNSIQN